MVGCLCSCEHAGAFETGMHLVWQQSPRSVSAVALTCIIAHLQVTGKLVLVLTQDMPFLVRELGAMSKEGGSSTAPVART